MCGFAGFYGTGDYNREEILDKMGEMIADIYAMLYDENVSDNLTYVNRLKQIR